MINPDDTNGAVTSRLFGRNSRSEEARVLYQVNCNPANICTCYFSQEPRLEVVSPPLI